MRVAITHDWLVSFGGAERVLAELLRVFPGAPIYTTVYRPAALPEAVRAWDVRPSFLQRVPGATRFHRALLPLVPLAVEEYDLSAYDLVVATSSAFAKGVITPPGTRVVCYCHTPPRYLWDQYHEQTRGMRGKALASVAAHWLRVWDRAAADRVDDFVANSATTEARIRRYYRRDSTVVYPPVDTTRLTPSGRPAEDFLLVVSRLVPYKRVDLAVRAAARVRRRLVVVGDGPERARLERLARDCGARAEFLGWRDDGEVADLYARARAFVFPGYDDFGIAPVEAQASGRPVVAFARGGATETVRQGETGVLFDAQEVEPLAAALADAWDTPFDPAACRANALRFDAAVFRARMAELCAPHDAVPARGPLAHVAHVAHVARGVPALPGAAA